MKSIFKPSHSINIRHHLSQRVFLTLALTSLLSGGIGLINTNIANAVSSPEKIQLSQNIQNLRRQTRLPKAVVNAILNDASQRSGVAVANLKITKVTAKTFANPCIFQFGEVCTREYKPIQGWEVIVQVNDQSWTYHTNRRGTQIVLDPKINASGNVALPKEIATKILNDAAKRSGTSAANLKITQVTARTFENPCVFQFGEICTKEYNPIEGWVVIVQVQGQSWTYHVNKSVTQFVLDPKVSASAVTLPKDIANKVLNDAARRSGIAAGNLRITQATARTFGNECHFNFGEVCAEIYKPVEGWVVIVQVKEQSWTYHVNKSGSQIVLDPKVTKG